MLGPVKSRDLDRPILVSLERLIPADHFYRYLDAHLDLSFVRDWVKDCYAANGRPSIDPVVFFRLELVLFFEGLRSERQLMRLAADRLSIRWYIGYDLDEPLPDHSSLTRIRQRLGLDIFRRFFEQVVELCDQARLIWGKEVLADATKVPGNAAKDSLVPRLKEVVEDHLVELFAQDEQNQGSEAEATEQESDPPVLLHPPPTDDTEGNEEEQPTRWDLLETCRLDPDRPVGTGYHRLSDRKISQTDPDATPILLPDGRSLLGYQENYLVDGGKHRIILHALVTPGAVTEDHVALEQLRRVQFRYHLQPRRFVADGRYGTIPNIKTLEGQGIRAYLPLRDREHTTAYFGPARFAYDAERAVFVCPQGELLRPCRIEYKAEKTEYRGDAATCNACPLKEHCTPSDQGRQVHRSFHAEYLERVRGYHSTPAFQKAMRKRSVWVEPLFGEAKQWHGLHRFRLRGLRNVNIEGLLVATGQNLKRWLAAKGWGRRQGPCGSLLASFQGVTALDPLLRWPHSAVQYRVLLVSASFRPPFRDSIGAFFNGLVLCLRQRVAPLGRTPSQGSARLANRSRNQRLAPRQ